MKIKEGGGMDLQKERELFLAHMRSIGSVGFMFELDDDGNFDDMSMAYAWSAWKAAQAVPEGFVLVPVTPSDEFIDKLADVICNEFDTTISGSAHCASEAYKAMVGELK